jgi:hypothetical protein
MTNDHPMDWLLRSIDAKLDRAENHLRSIEDVIDDEAVTDLMKTRTDRDRYGRVRVRVREIDEFPGVWDAWIGECIYNMRSALDHLAYGLNIIGSRQDPPPNWGISQFPIYSDRSTYRHGGKRGRPAKGLIQYFPRGAKAAVERVQPYHGRKNDPAGARRLSDLAELSNIDKHRRFPIAAVGQQGMIIPGHVEGCHVAAYTMKFRILEPGATIVWLEVPDLPRSRKEPNVDLYLMANIEFVGPAANPPVSLLVPSEPVPFTLKAILDYIRGAVLPELLPFVR